MSNAFSLKRVGLLIAGHWAENRRRYLLSALALTGAMGALVCLKIVNEEDPDIAPHVQMISYAIVLILVGNVFSSQYFSDLGSRPKAINYLLTPASHLEKLVTALFYTVVVALVVTTVAFYIVDVLAVATVNMMDSSTKPSQVINVFGYKSSNSDAAGAGIIATFLCVQSVYLLGSVYFNKYRYALTAVSGLLIILFVGLFIQYILSPLVPGGDFMLGPDPKYLVVVGDGSVNRAIPLPRAVSVITGLLPFLLPPVLWVTAWLRLKEKEV